MSYRPIYYIYIEQMHGSAHILLCVIGSPLFHAEEDNLFEVLSELVEVVQWKNFSLALGLLPSTVNKIAAKERGDVDNCLREALLAWLCWQDNTRATTWRELYQALRQCGCVSVAKQVARNHPQHPAAIPNSSPP